MAGEEVRARMRRALRDAVAQAGGTRRISGLALVAVLCTSAIAPVALVGQAISPVLAAWLVTAGSVGSNLLADVILSVVGRRASEAASSTAELEMRQAVVVELEARMARPGPEAGVLRGEVSKLLLEHDAQQVLLTALTEDVGQLRTVLAESVVMLAEQFEEFSGLLDALHDGVRQLREAAPGQWAEIQVQGRHRRHVQKSLTRILRLLEGESLAGGGVEQVFNTLPPDTAAFTGRESEIAKLVERVAAVHADSVAIHAIDGMPGVGKTTLALHLAHRLTAQYPDRQLFVDLHGHSETMPPTDPALLLTSLLVGDGLDASTLPSGLDELGALWRARMARRRVLLVLDDAISSTQVAPLLPGVGPSLILITSRRHLGDLPVAVGQITLGALPRVEAMTMFQRLASRVEPYSEQDLVSLVKMAGCLPLAIALYAAVYRKHSTWILSDLVREVSTAGIRLAAERRTVAAAFDLSYRTLPPTRQQFFRLLGLHVGVDLDPYAAAALTGTSPTEAETHLEALLSYRLLTETVYHRYRMHDLIRAHARVLTATTDSQPTRTAAVNRLLHYYAHTAQTASITAFLSPWRPPTGPAPAYMPNLSGYDAALSWLRAEYRNLEGAYSYARAHDLDGNAVALAAGLVGILFKDGPRARTHDLCQDAGGLAKRLGQPLAYAIALSNEAHMQSSIEDFPKAADAATRALVIAREIGDLVAEGVALFELAIARRFTDDLPGAADALISTLAIACRLGHRQGEAAVLCDLGIVLRLMGDYPGAVDALTRALEISREIGHRNGEAAALNQLGHMWRLIGDLPGAEHVFSQALAVCHETGDRYSEVATLAKLGCVWRLTGDLPKAARVLTFALQTSREIGERLLESVVLTELGGVWRLLGELPNAEDALSQALVIYREIGSRVYETYALNEYAATIAAIGDWSRALVLYQQALDINRELNKRDDEAISLEGIANQHLNAGDPCQGIAHLREALEIYQRLGMHTDIQRVHTRLTELATLRTACVTQRG